MVLRKWLNISAKESDYSADTEDDEDLNSSDSDTEGDVSLYSSNSFGILELSDA